MSQTYEDAVIGVDHSRDSDEAVYTLFSDGALAVTFTAGELTRLAVRAKSKVKASARGWSLLSQEEVLALAWFADLFLTDGELAPAPPAKPEPPVISNV